MLYPYDDSVEMDLAMGFKTPIKDDTNRVVSNLLAKVMNDGRFTGSFNLVTGEVFVSKLFPTRIEYLLLITFGFDTAITPVSVYQGQVFTTLNGRRTML